MNEWVVLINPRAGRRSVDTAEVAVALDRHGIPHHLERIDGVEDMRRAVIEVAGAHRRLCLVGGDGTVSMAVDAILDAGISDPAPIACLPGGTGSDLLRTFGVERDLVKAAAHLATPATYRIDVGVLDGEWGRRRFVNVAQAGVGAAAAETAPRLARSIGSVRYPLAFLARLPRFPICEIEVTGDRPFRGKALATIFANAQFFAGGWNVAPKALLMDGELDLQVIDVPRRAAPGMVPKVIKGVHLRHPGVTRRSLAAFGLHTEVPWPVEADGDYLGRTPVEVSVLPGAIEFKI